MPTDIEVKKTRTFRSLTVILTIAFLTLSLAVLLISSILGAYFNFQNQQIFVAKQQYFIAQDAANIVKGFVQDGFNVMEAATSLGSMAISNQEEQKLVMEKLLGLRPAFRQLILLNAQKQELVRVSRLSNLMPVQLTEQIKSDMFSQVSQRKTFISSIYIDKITSEPMVIMAVPVTDVFGDLKGILMTEVNLKFMWDLVSNIKVGNNGLAYVVDKQGNLIAFGDTSRVLAGENLIHLREVSKFVNSSELFIENDTEISEGIQGNDVVANYVPLGEPDWAVVIEVPVIEAYETVILGITLSVGVIILNTILVIVIGIYLSKRITNPIKKLTKNIEDISMGKLDVEVDPKLKESKDEIGALARAFDRTLVSLKLAMKQVNPSKKEEENQ